MDKYEKFKQESDLIIKRVLDSDSVKKIIIAGPGTGKSFLFQEICRENIKKGKKKNLALSFINELVDDLSKDLYELAEVRTLHSFALSKMKDSKMFFDLGKVIGEDYKIINDKDVDFNEILSKLVNDKKLLDFYSRRRKYYDFFSPNCSIYALVKYFEVNKDKIPSYHQVLIDEFQDFNKLEVAFIDMIAEKSPILLVGDDDQALYGSFKHADAQEIRTRAKGGGYDLFGLPFCRRCTEVIVNSFNDVVKRAKEEGFLQDRAPKDYIYFPTEQKDTVSKENPHIVLKRSVPVKATAFHIEKQIEKIFDPQAKTPPSVLIICSMKNQVGPLAKLLTRKGFDNIQYREKEEKDFLVEAFDLLLEDRFCNLGWRAIANCLYGRDGKTDDFNNAVKESYAKGETVKFRKLLDQGFVSYVEEVLVILRKVRADEEITEDESGKLYQCLGSTPKELIIEKVKKDFNDEFIPKKIYKNIPIKITTILGSKGLTYDHAFLVNFSDRYLLDKGKITDEGIFNFLVSLTRSKNRVYIYTEDDKPPTFSTWIDENNIKDIT